MTYHFLYFYCHCFSLKLTFLFVFLPFITHRHTLFSPFITRTHTHTHLSLSLSLSPFLSTRLRFRKAIVKSLFLCLFVSVDFSLSLSLSSSSFSCSLYHFPSHSLNLSLSLFFTLLFYLFITSSPALSLSLSLSCSSLYRLSRAFFLSYTLSFILFSPLVSIISLHPFFYSLILIFLSFFLSFFLSLSLSSLTFAFSPISSLRKPRSFPSFTSNCLHCILFNRNPHFFVFAISIIFMGSFFFLIYCILVSVWLIVWVLWHINLCRLFNTKSIFIQIICSISNNLV